MSDARNMVEAFERLVDGKIAKAMRGGSSTVPAEYMGEDSEGKAWVVLAGSGSMTPVRRSSVEASVGDTVSVTVADGMAVIDANLSDKSAGMKSVAVAKETAIEAIDYASQANAAASSAQSSATSALRNAGIAQASADSAVADAARANEAAVQAVSDAADAADAADSAKDSANKATYALSDVEKVVGTVNWIAEHGSYELTEDTVVSDSKTYYTRSGTSPNYVYTVVANPVASGLSTYYELELDESIQNFINAHVYLMTDGLYVTMDDDTHRVRIDSDSVDILDEYGAVVASFGVDGGRVGPSNNYRTEFNEYGMSVAGSESIFEVSSAEMSVDTHSQWEFSRLKYSIRLDGSGIEKGYIFELPSGIKAKSDIANFEWADGYTGIGTAGNNALQEDSTSIWYTKDYPVTAQSNFTSNPSTSTPNDITGLYLHDSHGLVSQYFPRGDPRLSMNAFRTVYEYTYTDKPHMRFGEGTLSASDNQAVFGRYNVSDSNDAYAVIVGNGTDDTDRSDALTVDWNAATMLWHPSIQRGTVPSSAIYGGGGTLELVDHDGNQIGYFQPIQLTNGSEGIQVGVSNEDGTDWNNIQLTFNGATPGISVSHKKEWRDALGALARVPGSQSELPSCTATSNVYPIVLGNSFANNGEISYMSAANFRKMIGAAMYDFYQATGASGTVSTTAGTITPITLVTTGAVSNGSGFSISGGGIKVANAGKYRVTASIYILGTNATFKGVYVKKNNNSTGATGELMGLHYPYTASGVQVGPKIVSLAANDVLYLCGRSGGVAGTIYTNNAQTYLLVERVV